MVGRPLESPYAANRFAATSQYHGGEYFVTIAAVRRATPFLLSPLPDISARRMRARTAIGNQQSAALGCKRLEGSEPMLARP